MTALLLALMGFFNIACFVIGAKVGQAVAKGEKIETPNVNPLKAYQHREAKKEAKIEREKLKKVLQNIDRYDGTSRGQVDVG